MTITGKPKDIHKLIKQVGVTQKEVDDFNENKETIFSFNKIIPMPESEKDNWYEWRVANWNTKWNADIQYETFDQWENGEVFVEFNTAWDTPTPIIEAVSKQNPKLTFSLRVREESHAFWQTYSIKNGKYKEFAEGQFDTCAEYNEFGVTHHNCEVCDEWVEFCNNSNEQTLTCEQCQAEIDTTEAQLNELDEELWKGEIDEATEKENAV